MKRLTIKKLFEIKQIEEMNSEGWKLIFGESNDLIAFSDIIVAIRINDIDYVYNIKDGVLLGTDQDFTEQMWSAKDLWFHVRNPKNNKMDFYFVDNGDIKLVRSFKYEDIFIDDDEYKRHELNVLVKHIPYKLTKNGKLIKR